jgi:hypothetical protein
VHATTAAMKTETRTITLVWTAKRGKKFDDYRRPNLAGSSGGSGDARSAANWKALAVV